MKQKYLANYSLLGIAKLIAYQRGLFVADELFENLKQSSYSGYRTASGIFIKLGGTLSKIEFEEAKRNGKIKHLIYDNLKEMQYEEYLKYREWATTPIFRKSSLTSKVLDDTFLILDHLENGKLIICGQYVDENAQQHTFKLNDTAIFLQGDYADDEDVEIQAGAIRICVSICSSNCVSGCSFCTFGSGSENYEDDILSDERLENEIKPLIREAVEQYRIPQLFITGGNPSLNDMEKWTKYLEESIKEFKSSIKQLGIKDEVTIDVMLTPRDETRYLASKNDYKTYLETLKSYGVTSISSNMEIWLQSKLMEYCPPSKYNTGVTKSEIGHDRYLDFIDAAVEVFGKFNVRSALIIGLNSIDETKEAIDSLIGRGCYVTLSPYKAPECVQANFRFSKDLSNKEPSCNELIELSEYLKESVRNYLETLSPEEKEICEINITRSLNAHNSHNTANLCSGMNLDRLEQKGYENGIDRTIVTNMNTFYRENETFEGR